jgi:hypothetical protein
LKHPTYCKSSLLTVICGPAVLISALVRILRYISSYGRKQEKKKEKRKKKVTVYCTAPTRGGEATVLDGDDTIA